MNIEIEYKRKSREPLAIMLRPVSEADRTFLARFWKALIFNDEVSIDNGDGTALCYTSGADENSIDTIKTIEID